MHYVDVTIVQGLFGWYINFTVLPCSFFTDFSDRISRSRRVGYESGEFEIVSS